MDFLFTQKNGVEVFTLLQQQPSILQLLRALESRLEKAAEVDRVAKFLLVLPKTVSTISEISLLMDQYQDLAELEYQLPGYRLAFVYQGQPDSWAKTAEDRWQKPGLLNKLAAIASGTIQAVDLAAGLASASQSPFKDNPHIRWFNNETEALEWLNS